LGKRIISEENGRYTMISGNMQATIGEATEPLVIEKKEEEGKSLALQDLLKGRSPFLLF
jgi:hypothetical protein